MTFANAGLLIVLTTSAWRAVAADLFPFGSPVWGPRSVAAENALVYPVSYICSTMQCSEEYAEIARRQEEDQLSSHPNCPADILANYPVINPDNYYGDEFVGPNETAFTIILEYNDAMGDGRMSEGVRCAAALAVRDLNTKNGTTAPVLATDEPKVKLRVRMMNDHLTLSGGREVAMNGTFVDNAVAIIGPPFSSISETTGLVGGALGINMISYYSTAASLSQKDLYPLFSRTIPSDALSALLLTHLLLGGGEDDPFPGWTALQVIRVQDAWAEGFYNAMLAAVANLNQDGANECSKGPMGQCFITGHSFITGQYSSIQNAISDVHALARSGTQSHIIVVLVLQPSDLVDLLQAAADQGMLAPNFAFIACEFDSIIEPEHLPSVTQDQLLGFLAFNPNFDPSRISDRWPPSGMGIPDYCSSLTVNELAFAELAAYDAVVALALGMGNCSFQKKELWRSIIATNFTGASGNVSFNAFGDRLALEQMLLNYVQVAPLQSNKIITIDINHDTEDVQMTIVLPQQRRLEEADEMAEGHVAEGPLSAPRGRRRRLSSAQPQVVWPGGGTSQPVDLVDDIIPPTDYTWLYVFLGCFFGFLFLVLSCWLAYRWWQRAKRALAAEKQLYQDNLERIVASVAKLSQLSFTVCYVRYDKFLSHGKLLSHEEARKRGDLEMFDDFDELKAFNEAYPTIFISHQVGE